MIPLKRSITSSVGRKFLMAASGICLILFVTIHLAGNLSLYLPEGSAFNAYAAKLEHLSGLLYVAEAGLAAVFLLHFVTAIQVTLANRRARGQPYARGLKSKGGESKANVSSRYMIVSGLILLAFLVFHLWQFKFGPSEEAGYVAKLEGEDVRDLYRLVVEVFQRPLNVALYVGVMLFLGLHVRHGFWSAFQSLGATNPRYSKPLYAVGVAVAVLLAAGFLFIPLWVYFDVLGVYK